MFECLIIYNDILLFSTLTILTLPPLWGSRFGVGNLESTWHQFLENLVRIVLLGDCSHLGNIGLSIASERILELSSVVEIDVWVGGASSDGLGLDLSKGGVGSLVEGGIVRWIRPGDVEEIDWGFFVSASIH